MRNATSGHLASPACESQEHGQCASPPRTLRSSHGGANDCPTFSHSISGQDAGPDRPTARHCADRPPTTTPAVLAARASTLHTSHTAIESPIANVREFRSAVYGRYNRHPRAFLPSRPEISIVSGQTSVRSSSLWRRHEPEYPHCRTPAATGYEHRWCFARIRHNDSRHRYAGWRRIPDCRRHGYCHNGARRICST